MNIATSNTPHTQATTAKTIGEFSFDANLLSEKRLHLCVVQLPQISITNIGEDASRVQTLATLKDLLHGSEGRHTTPVLGELVPGGKAALILLPEYSLSFDDWNAVDILIRSSNKQFILIAGFGITTGQKLINWQNASPEERLFGWDNANQQIAQQAPVNGAWCWMRNIEANKTTCILQIKNHLAPAEVTKFPQLQEGQAITCLRFNDVDIYPLICSELVQPKREIGSAQHRIEQHLQKQTSNKPVLITGSLMEDDPSNVNWQNAISDITNHLSTTKSVIFAIANQAHDKNKADESIDCWRSLSGVYRSFNAYPKGQPSLPTARALNTASIRGAVVRDSAPCVTSGIISWGPTYSPVEGAFLWQSGACYALENAGVVFPLQNCSPISKLEFTRFIKRFPPEGNTNPCIKNGLKQILEHTNASEHKYPERIIQNLLYGVIEPDGEGKKKLEQLYDLLHSVAPELKLGIYALATLKTMPAINLQQSNDYEGQLIQTTSLTHILVWNTRYFTHRAMKRALEEWSRRPGEHPKLLVFGQGTDATNIEEGLITGDRRTDISTAPTMAAAPQALESDEVTPRDISQPNYKRIVACVRADCIPEYYLEFVAAEEAQRFANITSKIASAFNGA